MKGIKPSSNRKMMKFKHRQKIYELSKRKYHKTKKATKISFKFFIGNQAVKTQKTKKSSLHMNETKVDIAYTKAQMARIVGFKDIYPELKVIPTIESLLEGIPRQLLIKLIQTITNIYINAGIERIQYFFSKGNQKLKDDFNRRFLNIANNNTQYVFCTAQTTTELLKYGFSINHKPRDLTNEENEENILKALLIINDNLIKYTLKTHNKNVNMHLAELLFINNFSQKDINNFDYNQTFRETFTKSIDLFEYISKDTYFKNIYHRFKEKLQINDYNEYISTILSVFTLIQQNVKQTKIDTNIEQWAGKFVLEPDKDKEKLIKLSVLDYISMPWDQIIPIDVNDDYKKFRDKPIIKFPDGSYEIVNVGFLIERLFSSLYFDFKTIAEELNYNLPDFDNEYKESFGEKTLLFKYIELANSRSRYKALSSKDCKAISKKGGEPDYYLKSNTISVFLFENKDISINAEIKQSRVFDSLIAEYKNKLLLKTHSNGKPLPKPKAIGIGQLVKQIKLIQTGIAFWDKTVSTESKIYPVLVVADSKLLPEGLSYIMQDWFQTNCTSEGVKKDFVRPLVVMSISTLLLYSKEFQEKGYEYYFEKYYQSIENAIKNKSNNTFVDIVNSCISFSEYMENAYSKNFIEIFDTYKEKIFVGSPVKQLK